MAVHLTAFHSAVSVCSSVLIVEWLFPGRRDQPWVPPWALVVPAVAMLTVAFLTYAQYVPPRLPQMIVAAGVGVLFVLAAYRSRRRPGPVRRRRPWLPAVVTFLCTAAHFTLTYAVPATGLPWPVGVAVAAAPLVAGVLVVRRFAPAGLAVVTGILSFFVLLDVLVGLSGRYDLIGGGLLTAAGLIWLHRRVRTAATGPVS